MADISTLTTNTIMYYNILYLTEKPTIITMLIVFVASIVTVYLILYLIYAYKEKDEDSQILNMILHDTNNIINKLQYQLTYSYGKEIETSIGDARFGVKYLNSKHQSRIAMPLSIVDLVEEYNRYIISITLRIREYNKAKLNYVLDKYNYHVSVLRSKYLRLEKQIYDINLTELRINRVATANETLKVKLQNERRALLEEKRFIKVKQLVTSGMVVPTDEGHIIIDHLNLNSILTPTVVVGLDEMDKIEEIDKMLLLLQHIKGIMTVEDVHYIVSISEDALLSFNERTYVDKNALDSFFDHILPVFPLDCRTSSTIAEYYLNFYKYQGSNKIDLIKIISILSSGIPRDIKRYCEIYSLLNNNEISIDNMTMILFDNEIENIITSINRDKLLNNTDKVMVKTLFNEIKINSICPIIIYDILHEIAIKLTLTDNQLVKYEKYCARLICHCMLNIVIKGKLIDMEEQLRQLYFDTEDCVNYNELSQFYKLLIGRLRGNRGTPHLFH